MPNSKTPLREIPSPDNNYCVCLFALPTPEGEPFRQTFTIYKTINGTKEEVFSLPEPNYCVDGTDYVFWDRSSTAISYSVNNLERITYHDFIFQVTKGFTVPKHLKKSQWDENRRAWILKADIRTEELRIEYKHINGLVTVPWKEMQIGLLDHASKQQHPLYKVYFHNSADELLYAELNEDCYVYNPTLITISEDGVARIPLCDSTMTTFFWMTCDLAHFGEDKHFIINRLDKNNSKISLPVLSLPSAQSLYFDVSQEERTLGESGVTEYGPIWFINRQNRDAQYSYDRFLDKAGQWNRDRTKFFFNGIDNMVLEFDPIPRPENYVFVVLDVKNRCCIKEYHGHAIHPRWNEDGTDVLFDNELERIEIIMAKKHEKWRQEEAAGRKANAQHDEELRQKGLDEAQEKTLHILGHSIFIHQLFETKKTKVYQLGEPYFILPSPDGLHCIYLKRRDRKDCYEPSLYDVSIIDKTTGITIVDYLDLVDGPDSFRQLSNGKVTYYSYNSSIVSFNMNDLYNARSISITEWSFHVRPSGFVWKVDEANPEDGKWRAVFEEQPSGSTSSSSTQKRGLRYTHQCPIRVFRAQPMSVFGHVNFETSDLFEIRQNKEGFDKSGLPKSESLKFINKADGKVLFGIDFELDFSSEKNDPLQRPVKAWNKSGTMFFFSGTAMPTLEWHDSRLTTNPFGHLLVVVDVKNKDIVKIYKYSHSCYPYWNEAGTKVLFFGTPEEHKECLEVALSKLHGTRFITTTTTN